MAGFKAYNNIYGKWGLMELFKLTVYITVPIAATIAIIRPGVLEAVIRNRAYVVYPPEGPAMPTPEQITEAAAKRRAKHLEKSTGPGKH